MVQTHYRAPSSFRLRKPLRALKLDYARITGEIQAVTLLLRRRKAIDAWAGMQDGFTILVAEDSPDDAKLLEFAIRRAGLQNPVRFVADGYEAIEYLQGKGKFEDRREYPFPKVIISDLKMPRLNGLELLDWLHQHPECKVLPTVLMSGSGLEKDIEKAYQLGANSYFQKPSTLEELTSLMRLLTDYWARSEPPPEMRNCP